MPRSVPCTALLVLLLATGACSRRADDRARPPGSGDPERGKRVYLSTCTACHASNPAQDGPLGPAVKGSSKELLRARVVEGTYPPGYVPKRETTVMKPLPQLEGSIDDLAAFLE